MRWEGNRASDKVEDRREVGHHVQNLLGISAKMEQMRRRVSQLEYNALSVRLELQACDTFSRRNL